MSYAFRLPLVPIIQASAIVITALFYAQSNAYHWLILVYIFAFSHYLIGAFYSRKAIVGLLTSPKAYLPIALLLLIGWYAYQISYSLLLYFAVHHALSEGYLRQRYFKLSLADAFTRRFQSVSFWLQLSGFFLLVRNDHSFYKEAYFKPALSVFIIALVFYGYLLWQNRALLKPSAIPGLLGGELVLFALLGVSLLYPLSFLQIVFYHFTLWALLPYLRITAPDASAPLLFYTALTVISLLIISYYSPYFIQTSSRFRLFEHWFIILSYAHITLSFAISAANPSWINRLFAKQLPSKQGTNS